MRTMHEYGNTTMMTVGLHIRHPIQLLPSLHTYSTIGGNIRNIRILMKIMQHLTLGRLVTWITHIQMWKINNGSMSYLDGNTFIEAMIQHNNIVNNVDVKHWNQELDAKILVLLLKWLILATKTSIIDSPYISFLTPIEFHSPFNMTRERQEARGGSTGCCIPTSSSTTICPHPWVEQWKLSLTNSICFGGIEILSGQHLHLQVEAKLPRCNQLITLVACL